MSPLLTTVGSIVENPSSPFFLTYRPADLLRTSSRPHKRLASQALLQLAVSTRLSSDPAHLHAITGGASGKKLFVQTLPSASPSTFFLLLCSVWTIGVMAGDPAAPLHQEVTLKVEATGT